jgi:hypothetical protein
MKKLIFLLISMLTVANTALAQIGNLSSDLVFVPITPCRIFDTRPSQGGTGAIPTDGTKNFVISGATSFASQGGAANDCGVSIGTNVAAAAINMTVVSGGMGGYITAYPLGSAKPLAATVNYGANDVRGNMAIVKVSQTGGLEDLSIYANQQTDVIGDIVGFYTRPLAGFLDCITTAEVTLDIVAGGNGALTIPSCPTGYNNTGGQCYTDSPDLQPMYSRSTCAVKNVGAATGTIIASRRCCRIPGR